MATLSVEQQIAMLRPTARFAAHMHTWLLAGAVAGGVVAVVFWHPAPLMIAAFLGIIGLSEQRAGPNIMAALVAYDSGTASTGEASIAITSWSDSFNYHATVREQGCPDWEFEFIPQGWQPKAGTCPARIWRAGNLEMPVLVAVDAGIMIPRYNPKHVGEADRSSST